MIKIEAKNLKEAYEKAAQSLSCSVTELRVEIIQKPNPGILGFLKKSAIIVAVYDPNVKNERKHASKKVKAPEPKKAQEVKKVAEPKKAYEAKREAKVERKREVKPEVKKAQEPRREKRERVEHTPEPRVNRNKKEITSKKHKVLNDTIMPASFVNDQDDDEYEEHLSNGLHYTADYDDEYDDYDYEESIESSIEQKAFRVEEEINSLFDLTCFNIEKIEVSVYDEETLLVEFKGDDSALLIGKEGYRYKALSYMIFNWINSKYDVQLRLEIAEFLQNQEDSVNRYLTGVRESIERDGRVQTKILDGVLVQIALKKLREEYPEKYVVIRSTRDGLKYIIVNDYHSN